MASVKTRYGWKVLVVGDQQRGWHTVPETSSLLPTAREAVLNLQIEGHPGDDLLVHATEDGALYGDTCHESIVAAENAALEQFGVAEVRDVMLRRPLFDRWRQ